MRNPVFRRIEGRVFGPSWPLLTSPLRHFKRPQGPITVFITSAHAQTPAPAPTGGASAESTLFSLLPLVLMFVVLYFIMIRPQMKRQKEHKAMIEALAKGDEVVTAGGLLGKVSKLGETYVHIEAGNAEVMVQRTAVVQVLPKGTIK
jgi:preprotein translocase subunit YajC